MNEISSLGPLHTDPVRSISFSTLPCLTTSYRFRHLTSYKFHNVFWPGDCGKYLRLALLLMKLEKLYMSIQEYVHFRRDFFLNRINYKELFVSSIAFLNIYCRHIFEYGKFLGFNLFRRFSILSLDDYLKLAKPKHLGEPKYQGVDDSTTVRVVPISYLPLFYETL